jgi:hypothetical protein
MSVEVSNGIAKNSNCRYYNLLAVALGMSSTLEMLTLCPTSRRLQLLKMQPLSGSMTPHKTTIGSLDVIAAIRMLAIKVTLHIFPSRSNYSHTKYYSVDSSIQSMYFQSTQLRCGIPDPVKIPLHSNIRWGDRL